MNSATCRIFTTFDLLYFHRLKFTYLRLPNIRNIAKASRHRALPKDTNLYTQHISYFYSLFGPAAMPHAPRVQSRAEHSVHQKQMTELLVLSLLSFLVFPLSGVTMLSISFYTSDFNSLSLHTPWRRIVGCRVWRRTRPAWTQWPGMVYNGPLWQHEKMGLLHSSWTTNSGYLFSLSSGTASEQHKRRMHYEHLWQITNCINDYTPTFSMFMRHVTKSS
jgi:hypothetical protein